jgi:hypothetical protein
MSNLIKKQASGTRTVAEFCRRHGIKPGKFFYWKRKMKDLRIRPARHSQPQRSSGGAFIPVTLPTSRGVEHTEKIELHFPSGLRACIPTSTGMAALKTILKACGKQ